VIQRALALLGTSDEYLTQFQRHAALARALGNLVVFIYEFDQQKVGAQVHSCS
jgi:hypothetical protein